MICKAEELPAFVARSDELGGPGSEACAAFWQEFTYLPTYQVDQDLDPFSEAYVAEQMVLHEEMIGRRYDVHADEHTKLDVDIHIAAPNPYNHPDPSGLALHLQRLSRALRHAGAKRGQRLIDMGCGWGLSSETAAYLGLSVRAVDINPDFVRLVNGRAQHNKLDISAERSSFEEYRADSPADLVLFYECFHHAVRPWVVLRNIFEMLRDGGRLLLAGEPINDYWWKHWGLRLDAMSVYCIHKFGWFESGWSMPFLKEMLLRAGLVPTVFDDQDPHVGLLVIAEKRLSGTLSGADVKTLFHCENCEQDSDMLSIVGVGHIDIAFPPKMCSAHLLFESFCGRELRVHIRVGNEILFAGPMQNGRIEVVFETHNKIERLDFHVERWMPDEELSNGDRRIIGIHLRTIRFSGD